MRPKSSTSAFSVLILTVTWTFIPSPMRHLPFGSLHGLPIYNAVIKVFNINYCSLYGNEANYIFKTGYFPGYFLSEVVTTDVVRMTTTVHKLTFQMT